MTGRTNALSGGQAKLFTPSAVISGNTLHITDRNGDFCSGFMIYEMEDEKVYFDRDENEVYLPEHFESGITLKIVSLSNILKCSDELRVRYEENMGDEE